MLTALVVIFVLAYAAIALEHPLRVHKTASALLAAGLLWTVYAVTSGAPDLVAHQLDETLVATSQVVFFLMAAMTIVEVVDAHDGFEVITARVRTTRLSSLMWLVGGVTFFLSAVLDNMTTTIVMVSLMKRLLDDHEDRLLFAGMIVIAANAGGAWTPIGDVTTTMLWIGGQITTLAIMRGVFVPSLLNLLVPLSIAAASLRGRTIAPPAAGPRAAEPRASPFERRLMFTLGIGTLLAVPLFRAVTGLPPVVGILFGLGLLWLVGCLVHRHKTEDEKEKLTLVHALKRIDMASVIFFVGILLAVATLEHARILASLAGWLERVVGREDVIVTLIGLLSAVVDNVPLVAASMGMYGLDRYPPDSSLWQLIACCAGTGGSLLIIGSAAGVAAMGLENLQFFWYLKRLSGLALLGYFAGVLAYLAESWLLR